MAKQDDGLGQMGDLDDLFAAARHAPPPMPKALEAAILQDAADLQQERHAPEGRATGANRRGGRSRLWQQFAAAIGGWPAVGGLAMASLTGLWIGIAPPSFLPDPAGQVAALASGAGFLVEPSYDISLLLSDEVFE